MSTSWGCGLVNTLKWEVKGSESENKDLRAAEIKRGAAWSVYGSEFGVEFQFEVQCSHINVWNFLTDAMMENLKSAEVE